MDSLHQLAPFASRYDVAANQLRLEWQGTAGDADLQQQYSSLLADWGQHQGCRFWLLDMRQRNWHTPEFGRWFADSFAAKLHALAGQPVFLAYIVSPAHYPSVNSPNAQAVVCACVEHDMYPFFFDQEAEALAWLCHQQRYDRAGA